MAKNKMKKSSKRRLIIFGIPCLLIIGYFIFSVVYSTYKIYNLKLEEKELNTKLEQLQKEEKNLSLDMEKLQDPEYLAKYAREAFSYSKPDEIIIQKYENQKKQKSIEKKFSLKDKYIIFIGIVIIFIVIFYVLIKSRKTKKTKKIKKNNTKKRRK